MRVTVEVAVTVEVKVAVAVLTATVTTAPFTGAPVTFRLLPDVKPCPVKPLPLAIPTV